MVMVKLMLVAVSQSAYIKVERRSPALLVQGFGVVPTMTILLAGVERNDRTLYMTKSRPAPAGRLFVV